MKVSDEELVELHRHLNGSLAPPVCSPDRMRDLISDLLEARQAIEDMRKDHSPDQESATAWRKWGAPLARLAGVSDQDGIWDEDKARSVFGTLIVSALAKP